MLIWSGNRHTTLTTLKLSIETRKWKPISATYLKCLQTLNDASQFKPSTLSVKFYRFGILKNIITTRNQKINGFWQCTLICAGWSILASWYSLTPSRVYILKHCLLKGWNRWRTCFMSWTEQLMSMLSYGWRIRGSLQSKRDPWLVLYRISWHRYPKQLLFGDRTLKYSHCSWLWEQRDKKTS